MAQFNADISLKVNSTPAERQVRKVEKAVEKVERASRDILSVDKQIVGERKKLIRLNGEQATRAKKRLADLRLQRTELTLQKRELQGIARLEKNRAKQVSGGGSSGGAGVNPVLLGAGAAAAARMSPARAFKQGDVVGQLKVDRNRLSDALDAIDDEVRDGTAKLEASLRKYRATVNKFGAGSSQARMSRNVGVRPKVQALRDSKFQQLYASGRLRDVDTTIESITNAQAKFNRQASRAASPINALGKQLLVTAGAYFTLDTAIRAVNAAARQTAQLQRLEIALKAITGAETPAALKAIERAVADFNIPIEDATRNFTQLAAAGASTGNSVEELETLYRGLAAATKATGGDAEDLNGVLRAATQVLSKNKVQAEELRGQIGDRLPGAFNLFAEATGRSAKELDKALKDGEVSAEEFVTKFGQFIRDKYEPAAAKIADSPAEAGARLQKELDNLNRGIGPALAELGAKFQDFATEAIKALTPLAEELARIFNIGQNANAKAYAENQKQLLRLLKEIEATEGRMEAARAAGQSPRALLGIQENLDSLERRRQELLKKLALQNASLGVNEGARTGNTTTQDDPDTGTGSLVTQGKDILSIYRDIFREGVELDTQRQNALRTQDQLIERLNLQIKLENSSTELEKAVNGLLLKQLELRQDINNQIDEADDPELVDRLMQVAKLQDQLLRDQAFPGIIEAAGFDMAADLAKGLNDELDQTQQIINGLVNSIGTSLVSAFERVAFGAESFNDVLADTLRALSAVLLRAGLNVAAGGDGVGLFSILNGTFGGFKASGGPVSAGTSYVVGEKGPELFVPNTSGSIVPNGAGSVTVVNNINVEKGTSTTTTQGGDAAQAKALARMMEASTVAIINREKRPGGLLSR